MSPSGPHQRWVADITCIAIASGFVYVAAVLDAWAIAPSGPVAACAARWDDVAYDNAKAASFMKTLKVEEVYLMASETFEDVALSLPRFIEDVYTASRRHSALGHKSPIARITPGRWSVDARECVTLQPCEIRCVRAPMTASRR